MNININIQNKSQFENLNEFFDRNNCLDLIKKKLEKKKEIFESNILNYSNPTKNNIPPNIKFETNSYNHKYAKESKYKIINNK